MKQNTACCQSGWFAAPAICATPLLANPTYTSCSTKNTTTTTTATTTKIETTSTSITTSFSSNPSSTTFSLNCASIRIV